MAQLRWLYPEALTDKEREGLLRRGTRTPQISGKPGSLTWSDIGESISGAMSTYADIKRAEVDTTTKAWSDVGEKLTTPGKTAGRPRGPVRGVERVPYQDPTKTANNEATNEAVTNVSTNPGEGTSEADEWTKRTDYANNPEGYVKSGLKEWTTDDPITKEAETVKGSEEIIEDPDGKLAEAGKIEREAIEMQPAANQGLKISKSQAADLMAIVGKKLMEPKARKGGPTDMNNPQWRAARGYGGSDFIRSWG